MSTADCDAGSLLGADVATVVAALDPPLGCRVLGAELHLAFVGDDEEILPDAVVLSDGVVVRQRRARRSPPSLHGYWLGQPIERVLPVFLPLLEVRRHGVLQELRFAQWRVAVYDGRIVVAVPGAVRAVSSRPAERSSRP